MKFQRIRRRVVEFPINSVIGGVQLLAEGARAEPEPVPKMELRRVTATRVEHWEKQNFFPLRNPVVIVNKLVSNISLCFFKENLHTRLGAFQLSTGLNYVIVLGRFIVNYVKPAMW